MVCHADTARTACAVTTAYKVRLRCVAVCRAWKTELVLDRGKHSQSEQSTRCKDDDGNVVSFRNNGVSEDRTCTEELTAHTDDGKGKGETKSHTKTIEERFNRTVLAGI